MSQSAETFAVILLIGPAPIEVERARDTVDSISAYEGDAFVLYLVDDDLCGRRLGEQIAPELVRQNRVVQLLNPRKGRGCGWGPGTAAAILAALGHIADHQDVAFAVKLDTDSLVINRFAEKVAAKVRDCPQAGVLGTYQFSPAKMKDRTSTPALEKLLRQFSIWRRTPAGGMAVQMAFWGKYKRMRNVLRQAVLNGYRLGEHCAGGGYAVPMACIRALRIQGLLDDPVLWLQAPLGDDPLLGLLCSAAGFRLESFDGEGEPFAVKHRGLPDTPERLIERGHSIVHSVKDHAQQKEDGLRSFFREHRKRTAPWMLDSRSFSR
jgi:hypothetical protein